MTRHEDLQVAVGGNAPQRAAGVTRKHLHLLLLARHVTRTHE
jgi:hypothetical protein